MPNSEELASQTEVTKGEVSPTINPGSEIPLSQIRLRYKYESNINPLYQQSYFNKALFALCYDSLFVYDSTGALKTNLAESASFSEDELIWTIKLQDREFHSGDKLRSSDVEASLRQWLQLAFSYQPGSLDAISENNDPKETADPSITKPAEEIDQDIDADDTEITDEDPSETNLTDDKDDEHTSTEDLLPENSDNDYFIDSAGLGEDANIEAYSGNIKVSKERALKIEAIGQGSEDTVKIKLSENTAILDLLRFPIIPADYVNSTTDEIIPGSGKYKITELDSLGNLKLSLAVPDDDSQVFEIIACNCSSVFDALNLFENNELDLLLLNREESSRLEDRTTVRSQEYYDSAFVSLYIPSSGLRHSIEDSIFTRDPAILSNPWAYSPYCLRTGDFRLINQQALPEETKRPAEILDATDSEADDGDTDNSNQDTVVEKCRVLMPRVYYPIGLKTQLESVINRVGKEAEYIFVEADHYLQSLQEEEYDIALLLDQSVCYGDPLDYAMGLLENGLITELEISEEQKQTLEQGRLAQAILLEESDFTESSYLQIVQNLFNELPVIGLANGSCHIWYRDGIEGALSGTAELPYEGVDSLIVWQP